MFSSQRSLRILIAVSGIAVLISQLGAFSHCYGSSKPSAASASPAGKSDLVVTEPPTSWCAQGLCIDIFPKDGRIEGKPVSGMSPAGVNSQGQVVGLCTLEDADDLILVP